MKRISLIVPTEHDAVVADDETKCSPRCPHFGKRGTYLYEYCVLGAGVARLKDRNRTKLCASSEVSQ